MKVKPLSHARLLATPWAAAYQAPPSMGFARQEYWSGVPLPSLQGKAIGFKYSVLITEVLLSCFSNTGDIYKILSNILGAPLWIYI